MKKTNKEVKKETEANLISFKVLLNRKNQIVTELSQLPEKHIDKIFKSDEAWVVRSVLQKGREKLSTLHDYLQKELQAMQDKSN